MADSNAESASSMIGNALDRLSLGHSEIRWHCTRLEQFVRDRKQGVSGQQPAPEIQDTITFLDIDVRLHHLIEDIELFPRLLALRLPSAEMLEIMALIAALNEDHWQLDAMWSKIKPSLLVAAQGGPLSIAADILTFVTSYRHHMKREDAGIFPFARRHLDSTAVEAIAAAMEVQRANRQAPR